MYDLTIIGGGVAALSAGIYAGRKKLATAIVAGEIGGQAAEQPDFTNYPGYLGGDGFTLVQNMRKQVEALPVDLKEPWFVSRVEPQDGGKFFRIVNTEGEAVETRAVLLASGGHPKKLNVPGEAEFYNKGVTYCATCDAPLFGGKRTVVVGGGNTGTEAALLLAKYCTAVTLIHNHEALKADEVTREKIAAEPKITVVYNAQTLAVQGDGGVVTGLTYVDSSGEHRLDVDGVFVTIGFAPNADPVKDIVALDPFGAVRVDAGTNMTSYPGIFAAGDVTGIPFKQAVIAAGEAAKAVLASAQWLQARK